MGVLLTLMSPCLLIKGKREFAALLILLWVATRATVAFTPLDFSYLLTSLLYTLSALVVMRWASYSLQGILIAMCLIIVSIAGVFASWGSLSLDDSGAIYEASGYIAMFLIIGPRDHGYLRNNRLIYEGSSLSFSGFRFRDNRTNIAK